MTTYQNLPSTTSEQSFANLNDRALELTSGSGLTHATVCGALNGQLTEIIYASSPQARALAELQEDLGEGPSWSALADEFPVIVPDLGNEPRAQHWLAFCREASSNGAGSMYAFPLQLGAVCVGVWTLHGAGRAHLGPDLLRKLMTLRGALSVAVLTRGQPFASSDEHSFRQTVTHQAAGMVMVQMRSSLEVALLRLRSYAYAKGQGLPEVAAEVVGRRLRFSPDTLEGVL